VQKNTPLAAARRALAEPDRAKAAAYDAVDRNAEQIATIGDSVYYFAELGMQEFESAKFVKGVLESIGFTVETGAAGMPTNIWAHWGTGNPQIVIASEIDALPEGSQTPGSIERKPLVNGAPGHMEGHNTHAGVSIGATRCVRQPPVEALHEGFDQCPAAPLIPNRHPGQLPII
jgi:aminobenzoyl-glutamate utilization protein B